VGGVRGRARGRAPERQGRRLRGRELAGLFLLGEKQLLVHCAHEQKTSDKALDRMEAIIEGCPDLSRRVKSIKRSNTHEGVYLKTGAGAALHDPDLGRPARLVV
jgi:hypothetical protein